MVLKEKIQRANFVTLEKFQNHKVIYCLKDVQKSESKHSELQNFGLCIGTSLQLTLQVPHF